jgi:hypothetical protein
MKSWLLLLIIPTVLAMPQRDQRSEGTLKPGDAAPDFKLKILKSKDTFKLSDNFGKRAAVLIFGSYT